MADETNPLIDLAEAFASIGHPIYKDEHLGRVLAWACLSGFCEAVVTNKALYSVVRISQKRFKLEGGCVPDIEAMNRFYRPALRELAERGKETPWLRPLMERYHVTGWDKLNYL